MLDYGCGVGALAMCFSPERYVGVDDDVSSLSIANKVHPAHAFLYTDELCMIEGVFDSIALLAVIEHVHDCENLLSLLGSLLVQDGFIALTTPLPMAGFLHQLGACIGVLSKEAHKGYKTFYGHQEIATMNYLFGIILSSIIKRDKYFHRNIMLPALFALVLYLAFFAGTSFLFFYLGSSITEKIIVIQEFLTIAVFFCVAWASGFMIPGAPGGLGVREGMLITLLSPLWGDGNAIASAMLFRFIAVAGDVLAFFWGIMIAPFFPSHVKIRNSKGR